MDNKKADLQGRSLQNQGSILVVNHFATSGMQKGA